jgi:ferric-dicitrate binding protein FerR (iron transport regulator)
LLPSAPGIVVRRSDAPAVVTSRDSVALLSGDELQTAAQGTRITFNSGIGLRIAPHSDLRLSDLNTVTLVAGALYFEGAAHEAALTVNTSFGSVTHVGTRYLAELTDSALIVLVRDGETRVTAGDRRLSVPAREQLILAADGHAKRSAVSSSGEMWSWADALAPAMEIENQHLDAFLAWIAHETGRQLNFADETARAEAQQTILHGSVANLSLQQALTTVLMTTDFDDSIDADRLVIKRKTR